MSDSPDSPDLPGSPAERQGPRLPDPQPRPAPARPLMKGVPPGETSPAEGGLSGTGPPDTPHNPTKGWSKGPLAAILLVALFCAAFFLAYAVIVQFR